LWLVTPSAYVHVGRSSVIGLQCMPRKYARYCYCSASKAVTHNQIRNSTWDTMLANTRAIAPHSARAMRPALLARTGRRACVQVISLSNCPQFSGKAPTATNSLTQPCSLPPTQQSGIAPVYMLEYLTATCGCVTRRCRRCLAQRPPQRTACMTLRSRWVARFSASNRTFSETSLHKGCKHTDACACCSSVQQAKVHTAAV
jgi:hypothetical protein